jgi:hypothetical protein
MSRLIRRVIHEHARYKVMLPYQIITALAKLRVQIAYKRTDSMKRSVRKKYVTSSLPSSGVVQSIHLAKL